MKQFLLLFILSFSFVFVKAQNDEAYSILTTRGEICFSFEEKNKEKINELSKIISIDKIDKAGNVTAYANKEEFEKFLKKGYLYRIILTEKSINSKAISMASSIEEMQNWDRYPTYQTYLQLMESFQLRYPEICRIDTIGYSVKERLILSARISIGDDTPGPEFFYSSTMHGDEVTGFLLMLRLIGYLLSNYGEDENITWLINSINIYINPNANPDGTYPSDNNISSATRYNANRVDLNRNYPNPFSDKSIVLQIENEAMINYIKEHRFVMSANIHGGAEVINFPWDSFYSGEKRPADSLWWINVSRQFVDTCRGYSSNSFSDTDISGITYGGDWYKVLGGRQDYVNAALNLRELTMEISTIKILPTDSLNSYWEMLRQPFLNYIEQASFGIHGIVTDSLTQEPVKAKIWIENHDDNESFVYSNSENGYFYGPISPGTYDITFSAQGYNSKTIKNVFLRDGSTTSLSVSLSEDLNKPKEEFKIYPNPVGDFAFIECKDYIKSISLFDTNGKKIIQIENINQQGYFLNTKNLHSGVYLIYIHTDSKSLKQKLIIYK